MNNSMALDNNWKDNWTCFKNELPHQTAPFSKKNWGNINHSLCSYQGKLKPAIAYHLVKTFVPSGGKLFDPFAGVGTIPFEGALNGIESFGMDISNMCYYISQAKVGITNKSKAIEYIEKLNNYIKTNNNNIGDLMKYASFGLNKCLLDYYEKNTFKEILLARLFFLENRPQNASEMVVISSLLHILHGNRPYALSRKSHPITPYAPTGDFIYKDLISKLKEKVNKYFSQALPETFVPGKIFLQDSTFVWPHEVNNLDAIITSPPFYDSTRFYSANWIRLWFSGWEPDDFKIMPQLYIDERQKKDFEVYNPIFNQAKERIKNGGVFVLHLGKSKKCNMGEILKTLSKRWFNHSELFDESVVHCDKFGIKDLGTVTDHQYLLLY